MAEEVFGFSPKFDAATFRFVQDGNTLGTTEDPEYIEIRLETQLPGDDPFFVIKTKGWSFDSIDELVNLIKRCIV